MSKVAVIGAGAVGTSVAYALLIKEVARHVVLYDIDKPRVDAEVLDLAHGTLFMGSSRISGGSDPACLQGANVVVITAGAKQKPGQTRLDLAGVNVKILRSVLPMVLERADPNVVIVMVTNPCDVLATVAQRISGLPASRIFSSGTVLDSARLRWLLGERVGISSASIHAYIVGEHGDSQFPLWSQARVGPAPLLSWKQEDGTLMSKEQLDQVALDVKNAAYKIIEGKGMTNNAIGVTAAHIVSAILKDSNLVLPVSAVLTDYNGVSGVALSVPTVVNRSGASRAISVPMAADELERFQASAKAVQNTISSLGF